ncbi:MAG: amidohydrolase family protein [Deltaproteobacteria bacterium]|nr:amidohydrolase family protein [Deltaproteobacteria bacterium]
MKTRTLCALVAIVLLSACAKRPPTAGLRLEDSPDRYVDAHFHVSNYAYQGVSLKTLIDRYMGEKIVRSVVMPLPLQQKWDPFEHYAQDRMPPNYYLGPKAELYYYAFADAMIAKEYGALSEADKARVDPMITGFNPMDRYAPQHIERVLLTFPGVFTGIGELTVHKELVSNKIAGDAIAAISSEPVPPDVAEGGKLTLYSAALVSLFDLVAETGLVATLHNDIYETDVKYDGTVVRKSPDVTYERGLEYLCTRSPDAKVIWAHTGLGRFVTPASNHLAIVSHILDACPSWSVDISWDLVQTMIVNPAAGMPSLSEWAGFITRYQDRVLWGSDTVIHSRNKVGAEDQLVRGGPMSVADYQAVADLSRPLWDALGPDVSRKVRVENSVRLFDGARAKVRAWEALHVGDDVWNLAPPSPVTP